MTRLCVSCQTEYKPRRSDSRLYVCPECEKNGVRVACAYCGNSYVMPFPTYKNYVNSGRKIAHAACSRADKMSDPAHAEKISLVRSEQAKKVWASDGHRERQSLAHKAAWTDKMRVKQAEIVAARFSDPEERRKQSERTASYFADAAVRSGLSAKMKEVCNTSEWRAARYGERSSCWEDSDFVRKQTENVSRVMTTLGNAVTIGDVWRDADYRAAWIDWVVRTGGISARDSVRNIFPDIAVGAEGKRLYADESAWREAVEFVRSICGDCVCVDIADFTGYGYPAVYDAVARYGLDLVTFNNSALQSDVLTFIRSVYSGPIEVNKQHDFLTLESGAKQQLDVFIPEFNLGLEVNGVYWHSRKRTPDKYYHFNKSKLCRDAKVRLIHVWGYVWDNPRSRAVVESVIKHALRLSKPVNARDFKVTYRKSAEMRQFFDANNVMGFRGGEFAVCLEDKSGEVWMAYIIGKGNHMSKGYAYEVVRGASKLGYSVRGGAGKLMTAFIRDKQPAEFVYFVDYNYFAGDSLINDDRFKLVAENVGYKNYWVKDGVVRNREPRRHREIKKLVEQGEVLEIYDAGTATYLYKDPNLQMM